MAKKAKAHDCVPSEPCRKYFYRERSIFPKGKKRVIPIEEGRDSRETKTTDVHCRNKAKAMTQAFPNWGHESSFQEPEYVFTFGELPIHYIADAFVTK